MEGPLSASRFPVSHDTTTASDLWQGLGVLLALNLLFLGISKEIWTAPPAFLAVALGADGIALAALFRAMLDLRRGRPLPAIWPEGLWTRDNGLLAWKDILGITVENIQDEADGGPAGRALCVTLSRKLNGPISSLFSTHSKVLWIREARLAMPIEIIAATIESHRPGSPGGGHVP